MRRTATVPRMRRLLVLGPVMVLLLAAVTALAAPASATQGFCGQAWGSLPKELAKYELTVLTGVRSARHGCYDRLVFDLDGPTVGYRVEYVNQVVQDGSGLPVPLRGGAFLSIVLSAPAHDASYRPTYQPADPSNLVNVTGYTTFRQVAFAGTFEGLTTIGLGVRAKLPFRVIVLSGPGTGSRIIVDVGHLW